MAFGVLSTGFVPKTLTDIRLEIEADFKAAFGDSINLDPSESVFGRLIGILSERYAELWDLSLAVYASQDPDQATGAALDALCALSGVIRRAAEPSTASVLCVGTVGTSLAASRRLSVASDSTRVFLSDAVAVIGVVSAWVAATAYVVGDRVTNDGNVYQCTTAGTSAGSGGPAGEGSAIDDNGTIWRFCGEGLGAVVVPFTAQETGAIAAPAFTLTEIETPVSGWNNAINFLDAELGSDLETDSALRLRREASLEAPGSATGNAIRARLLEVTDVDAVIVFKNNTDATDVNGLPPHSVECLVSGGTDEAVGEAVFDVVAYGLATFGGESVALTDDSGQPQTVYFSRPTEIEIYCAVTVEYDADLYPDDGDDQVKAAIVAFGDALPIGQDVRASQLESAVFAAVPGVLEVSCNIGTAPAPATRTKITITIRQVAEFDTTRVTVTSAEASEL